MAYVWDFDVVLAFTDFWLKGASITLAYAFGTIIGGLIIGVVQQMSTAFLVPSYKPVVAFAVMILVLLMRPRGIFGGRRQA